MRTKKEIKQGYGIILYFKLMLNKQNVMGGSTFIYTPLEAQFIEISMEVSICPLIKEVFESLPNYK
jgi:hypothetical protein